jgi:hypothetical protein
MGWSVQRRRVLFCEYWFVRVYVVLYQKILAHGCGASNNDFWIKFQKYPKYPVVHVIYANNVCVSLVENTFSYSLSLMVKIPQDKAKTVECTI